MRNEKQAVQMGCLSALALAIVIVLITGIRVVDQSETCAVVRLGSVTGRASTGLNLVVPFMTDLECYPAASIMFQIGNEENPRADYWDYPVEIKTLDGQTGNALFNILWSVEPSMVVEVRSSIAQSEEILAERVVANFARSIPRDIAANYTADGLYATDRAAYSADVEAALREKYAPFGVILISFDLRDIQFSEEYEDAIEQQQIAEEQIQTAEFVTEQKRQEAEQARIAAQGRADSVVIEAQAEAEALSLVGAALNDNPQIVTYEYVTRLATGMDVMMVPAGQDFIYTLPSAGGQNEE